MRRRTEITLPALILLMVLSPIAEAESQKKSLAMFPVAPGTVPLIPKMPVRSAPVAVSRSTMKSLARRAYPADHFQRGMYLRKIGRNDDALIEFLKAVQENPRQTRALYEQALIFKQKGFPKLAQSSLRHALAIDPSYRDARVLLAGICLEIGEVGEAARELGKSLGLNLGPDTPDLAPDMVRDSANVKPPGVIQIPHGPLPEPVQTANDAFQQGNAEPSQASGASNIRANLTPAAAQLKSGGAGDFSGDAQLTDSLKGIPGIDPQMPIEGGAPATDAATTQLPADSAVSTAISAATGNNADTLMSQTADRIGKLFDPVRGFWDRVQKSGSSLHWRMPDMLGWWREPAPSAETGDEQLQQQPTVSEPKKDSCTPAPEQASGADRGKSGAERPVAGWIGDVVQSSPDNETSKNPPQTVKEATPERKQESAAPVEKTQPHPGDKSVKIEEPKAIEPEPQSPKRQPIVEEQEAEPIAMVIRQPLPEKPRHAEDNSKTAWMAVPSDLFKRAMALVPGPANKAEKEKREPNAAGLSPAPKIPLPGANDANHGLSGIAKPIEPVKPLAVPAKNAPVLAPAPALAPAAKSESITVTEAPAKSSRPPQPLHDQADVSWAQLENQDMPNLGTPLDKLPSPVAPQAVANTAAPIPKRPVEQLHSEKLPAPVRIASSNVQPVAPVVSSQVRSIPVIGPLVANLLKTHQNVPQAQPRASASFQVAFCNADAPVPSGNTPKPVIAQPGLPAPHAVQRGKYTAAAPAPMEHKPTTPSSPDVLAELTKLFGGQAPQPKAAPLPNTAPAEPWPMAKVNVPDAAQIAIRQYVPVARDLPAIDPRMKQPLANLRSINPVSAPVANPVAAPMPPQVVASAKTSTPPQFKFSAPALAGQKQYVVNSARAAQPAKPAPPPEDDWTRRMKYLMQHGTSSLGPGECFMFSEETGEGVMFLPGGKSVRRQLASSRDHEELVRVRRPDIEAPSELQYQLSLLGKIMTRKEQPATPGQPQQAITGLPNELMKNSQGIWSWVKNVFKF